jgi:pullulanase/glycogen debranching enzyme
MKLNEVFQKLFEDSDEKFPAVSWRELQKDGITCITYYQQMCFLRKKYLELRSESYLQTQDAIKNIENLRMMEDHIR